jgi:hypothetical protein
MLYNAIDSIGGQNLFWAIDLSLSGIMRDTQSSVSPPILMLWIDLLNISNGDVWWSVSEIAWDARSRTVWHNRSPKGIMRDAQLSISAKDSIVSPKGIMEHLLSPLEMHWRSFKKLIFLRISQRCSIQHLCWRCWIELLIEYRNFKIDASSNWNFKDKILAFFCHKKTN